MQRYSVGGRTAATVATADNFGAALWNPSTSKVVYVVEVWWFKVTATADNIEISRITARGTATSTATPDIDNDWERLVAPPSGALLDVTYSAQPTLQTPPLMRTNLPAAIGAGFIYVFARPIKLVGSEGLGIATPVATALQAADVTFVWEE